MKKQLQNKSRWVALGLMGCLLWVTPASFSDAVNEPIPVASGFGRGVQRLLGMTSVARIIGEKVLAGQIQKHAQGQVDVDLTPYSATDLAHGKVKRMSVHGKNLVVDKAFYVSALDIVSDEDTPVWVELKHGKLLRPVEADFKITLTESDMAHSFETAKLKKKLARIKAPVFGGAAKRLSLSTPAVTFNPQGLQLSGTLAFEGAPSEDAIPLVITSGLAVDSVAQKPRFTQVHVQSRSPKLDATLLTPLMQEALDFISDPDKLIPMDKGKLRVRQITLTETSLTLQGHVWLLAQAKQ